MNRDDLEQVPAGTELLRQIRYMRDEDLAPITDDELEIAARWLHAAAYSCSEGARRIEAHIIHRGKQTVSCESLSSNTPETPHT